MTECPDPSVLRRLAAGELSDDDAAGVRTHVQGCDACRARLADLDLQRTMTAPDDDAFVEGARLQPGTRIDGYVIREFIAAGGFGEVYLARQDEPIRLDRVALKVIRPGLDSRQVLARFEDEREKLALMDHENIARIHDAGTTPDGRPYFVMEYVAGVPITQHCDRLRLSIPERLELFCKVCDAIQHSHQKSVVHRDIKPGNILVGMVNGRATPKVIDFGVAKALHRPPGEDPMLTREDVRVGTLPYMAPEQADPSRQGIDTRIDIYALGVLLYELLTGVLPFDPRELRRAGERELIRQIRDVEPQRPSERLSSLSDAGDTTPAENRKVDSLRSLGQQVRDDLDWITLRCLEKDRERRYASAEALALDVRRFLEGRPVSVGPPSVRYRVRKFLRRNRGRVAAAAAFGVLLMAGLVVGGALWADAREERRERERLEADLSLVRAEELLAQARIAVYHSEDDARAFARDALELNPDLVAAKVFLASRMAVKSDQAGALEMAQRTHAEHPESDEAAGLLAGLLTESDPAAAARLKSAARSPRDDHWNYFLSLGTTDHERAIELLRAALDENPWYRDAQYALADRRIEAGLDADKAARSGFFEAALADATLLTRVDREKMLPWILVGTAQTHLERHEDAAATFTNAIGTAPENWFGYYARAWARHRADDFDGALADLDVALKLAPADARKARVLALIGAAHIKRGEILQDRLHSEQERALFRQELEAALEALTASLAIDPRNPLSRRDRGDALFLLMRYDEAASDLEAALALPWTSKAKKSKVHERLGATLLHLRRLDEARDAYEASLALDPGAPMAQGNLGRVLLLEGKYREAFSRFDRAVELRMHGWSMYSGIAHWMLGEHEAAVAEFAPLAEGQPPWVYLWLWELHAERGDESGMTGSLDAAIDAGDGAEPGSDRLAIATIARGMRGELTEGAVLEAVGDDPPTRTSALYSLGAAARLAGREEDARRLYREALALGVVDDVTYELAELHLGRLDGTLP